MTTKISNGRYDVLSVVFVSVVDVVIVLSGLRLRVAGFIFIAPFIPLYEVVPEPIPVLFIGLVLIKLMISPNCPKNVYKLHI